MREKLTDRRVEQLKPADRRIDIWDANLPAFGIRINSNGSKTWIAALRRGGSSSRITLGRFPTMRIAEARARARALMTGETAAPTPRSMVLADFVARFLAHGRDRRGRPVRPATMRMYRLMLEQIAAPLHRMPIAKIRRGDIASLLHEVATMRGPASAALTRNILGRFFGWLIEIDVLEASPVQRAPIYAATRGKRVLSDGEIRAIWHGSEGPFGSILRLCLLLGARRGEVGGMRWSELERRHLDDPGGARKDAPGAHAAAAGARSCRDQAPAPDSRAGLRLRPRQRERLQRLVGQQVATGSLPRADQVMVHP